MSIEIPSDYSPVVQRLIAEGKFRDEEAVVAEGLRLIVMREKLHEDVLAGLAELDSGQRIEAREVYAEARRRIQAMNERAGK